MRTREFRSGTKYFLIALALVLLLPSCWTDDATREPGDGGPGPDSLMEEPATEPAARSDRKPGFTEDYIHNDRVIWQKPDLVLELLGNVENKTVADIGAGTGFFALRLAPRAAKVIAIDIDSRFLQYLDSVKQQELPADLQNRIETRLGAPDDPHLKAGEADVVMIVNTYMYIKDRVSYLRNLKNSISDGGALLIIDFKKKRTPVGPPKDIRIPLFQVEDELYEAGYRNIQANDTALDYQYIIMAEK